MPPNRLALSQYAAEATGSKVERLHRAENADRLRLRKAAYRTAWFTSGVLALICAASAFIALASSSTAGDLRGMLGLGFEVTQGMIVALILVGGVVLLALDWGLSLASVRIAYLFFQRKI